MAVKRPLSLDPGAAVPKLGSGKMVGNIRNKQDRPVAPETTHGVVVSSAKVHASQNGAAALNPGAFLTKFGTGKTSREYKDNEVVFSQGDAADAVFYIQSGKVKLTAVSAQGKEAVVAILPEGSFFGEGCLAGQPLRMATATALQRAAIIRVTN